MMIFYNNKDIMMSCSHLKLVRLFVLLAVLVWSGSCRSDDPEYDVPESPALVTLSVSSARAGSSVRALLPSGDQDKINSVYVLQFTSGSGGGSVANEKLVYVAEGKWNDTKGKYEATLLKSADSRDLYRVVILANIDGGFLYALYGNTYGEIQQRCLSGTISGPLSFAPAVGIPMFGVARRNAPFEVGAGTDIGEVQLLRSVARVDVGIGLYNEASGVWDKNGVDFRMTDIQVWKAGERYAWMPVPGNYVYTDGGPSVTAASPAGGLSASPWIYDDSDIVSGLYCKDAIFLPETDLSGHVFDANHTNRPAIIVGGHYPAASLTKSWYRIDFTTSSVNSSTASLDLDILRNHLYRFTIKRVGAAGYASAQDAYEKKPLGLGFTAGVKGWEEGITGGTPVPVSGVRMLYKLKPDGSRPRSRATGQVYEKAAFWRGRLDYQYGDNRQPFDYNDFYGEGTNFYFPYEGVGSNNGDIYHYGTVSESETGNHNLRFSALWVEGAYPSLMIAPDDLTDVAHADGLFPWRSEDGSLTAFDACRAYEGGGYTDWRLPRLSELALMFVNKEELTSEYPAAVFRYPTGKYWSGNEYAPLPSGLVTGTGSGASYNYTLGVKSAGQAWAFNFDVTPTADAGSVFEKGPWPSKSEKRKVRCVRQIGSDLDKD